MRSLFTLCILFIYNISFAQSFNFSARGGIVPFNAPAYAKEYQDIAVKTSFLAGLAFAYNDEDLQAGIIIDRTTLDYKYTVPGPDRPFPFEDIKVRIEQPFFNTALFLNLKSTAKPNFLYAGLHAGLFLPGRTRIELVNEFRSGKIDDGDKSMGISLGGQVGGQLHIASRLNLSLEAGVRYARITVKELLPAYDIRWYEFGGESKVYFRPVKSEVLYFPVVLSLSYEI